MSKLQAGNLLPETSDIEPLANIWPDAGVFHFQQRLLGSESLPQEVIQAITLLG